MLALKLSELDDATFEAYLAYRDVFNLPLHSKDCLNQFLANYLGLFDSMQDFVAAHPGLEPYLKQLEKTTSPEQALRKLAEELSGQIEFVQYHSQVFAFLAPEATISRKELEQ